MLGKLQIFINFCSCIYAIFDFILHKTYGLQTDYISPQITTLGGTERRKARQTSVHKLDDIHIHIFCFEYRYDAMTSLYKILVSKHIHLNAHL